MSVFVDKCLTKNEFQEDHVALFLADFNVDANQGKYPLHFISSFEKKEVSVLGIILLSFYHMITIIKIASQNQ